MVAARGHARRRGAFTLIELLIVILVMAILMAIALPLYIGAIMDCQRKTCRANMQTIVNAEQAYRTQAANRQYTTNLSDLLPNLGSLPICPNYPGTDASYAVTIRTDGLIAVSCKWDGGGNTARVHGTFVPGVDSE